MDNLFQKLQTITDNSKVVIDRPKGSKHPRYDDYVYPMDYGYLDGTKSQDGGGIDVWIGSGDKSIVSGILVIADALKKDSEIKILLGCTREEIQIVLEKSNRGDTAAILVKKEEV